MEEPDCYTPVYAEIYVVDSILVYPWASPLGKKRYKEDEKKKYKNTKMNEINTFASSVDDMQRR